MERVRLAQARYHRGWTLEEAAEKLGIDKATLGRWEKGKASPQARHMQRLIEVYGISAKELDLTEAHPQIIVPVGKFPAITAFLAEDLTTTLMHIIVSWRSTAYDEL